MRLKRSKKTILLSIIVVAALTISVSLFLVQRNNSTANIPEGIAGRSEINYGPPTEEEKAVGDAQKDKAVQQQQLDNEQAHNSTATVIITDSSYYADNNAVEVRAYVSNIFEDGGTCTATFTQGSQTITKTSQAFKDASTTQCGNLNTPRSDFSSTGTWNLVVTYSSANANGQQTSTVKL